MTLTDEIKPTVICHEVGWAEESIWAELWYRHCFRDGKCVDCDTADRRKALRTKDDIGELNYRKGFWETRGGLFD